MNNKDKVKLFASYDDFTNVKVNGEAPSDVFPTSSYVEIPSVTDPNSDTYRVARKGIDLYKSIADAYSDTNNNSKVIKLVNDYTLSSVYSLPEGYTLRVGAGVTFKVSDNLTIDGIENFYTISVDSEKKLPLIIA